MTVYLDVLFLEELLMDVAVLVSTARFSGRYLSFLRLLAAAASGAAAGTLLWLVPDVLRVPLSLVLWVLPCTIAFRKSGNRMRIFALSMLIHTSFGGGLGILRQIFHRENSRLNNVIPLGMLLLFALLCTLMCGIFLRKTAAHAQVDRQIEALQICFLHHCVTLQALCDTGNELSEPLSGKPAIVIEKSAAERLLQMQQGALEQLNSQNAAEMVSKLHIPLHIRCGLLPYTALGQCGMLLYLRPDWVRRQNGTKYPCVLAISPNRWDNGEYEVLIGNEGGNHHCRAC